MDNEDFLDLAVLKGILSDKNHALTFNHKYSFDLFGDKYQVFSKLVTGYISSFRVPPTLRTLSDHNKDHEDLIKCIWKEIYNCKADPNEYTYNLSKLKSRFQKLAALEISKQAARLDSEKIDPEKFFKKMILDIQRVTALDVERGHIQRPVGDYIQEFKDHYDAVAKDPGATSNIKTNISLLKVF